VDRDHSVAIGKGLNVIGGINLDQVSQSMQTFVNTIKPFKSVVIEGEEAILHANLAKNVGDTEFDIQVPLYIGVDFEKLYKQGALSKPPKGIKKITTDGFVAAFDATAREINFSTGVTIVPTTQSKPVSFQAAVKHGPKRTILAGKIDGAWDPAIVDWLALNNAAIEVVFDYANVLKLKQFGIPLSEIKITGDMGIGPKDNRTTVELDADIAIRAKERRADVVFSGKVDRIELSQLIHLLNKVSGKKIAVDKLPRIALRGVSIQIASKDTKIGNKVYEEGLQARGNIMVDKFKGGMNLLVDTDDDVINATGYLEEMDYGVFAITGRGPDGKLGTNDDQAEIALDLPVESGKKTFLNVAGVVKIPLLDFEQEAQIQLVRGAGAFTLQGKVKGLQSKIQSQIDFDDPANTTIQIEATRDAKKTLMSKISNSVKKLRDNIKEKADSVQKDLAQKRSKFGADKLQKARELKAKIKDLQIACGKVGGIKKAIDQSCIKLRRKKIQVSAIEFGNIVVDKALQVVSKITKELGKFQNQVNNFNNVIEGLRKKYEITSIGLKLRPKDFKEGKAPKFIVGLAGGQKFEVAANKPNIGKAIRDKTNEEILGL
jgi:hypothetical protein